MHMWVTNILPDVPVNSDDEVKYIFKSTFIGSYLFCEYQQGIAVFKSENISTIAVIKNYIV